METAGEKYYGGVGETPEKEALLILSFTNTNYKPCGFFNFIN
jgi:hypothetical protein